MPLPLLCTASYFGVGRLKLSLQLPLCTAKPHRGRRAGRQAAECGLSTSQELVSEARHGGFYSPACFCIIESGDRLKPETGHSREATCRFDESIYCSRRQASSKKGGTLSGLDQIKTDQWKSSLCFKRLSSSCTLIYVDTYIQKS